MTRHLAVPGAGRRRPSCPAINDFPAKLKGSGTVRVCSYGGAFQAAQRQAYFKPFEELSGIKVVESEGPDIAKVKAMVDTGNVEYDVGEFDRASVINLARKGEYWEPIDYALFDVDNIDTAFREKDSVAMLPYGQIIGYRTDAFEGKAPADNPDLWNVDAFPGYALPAGRVGRAGARPRSGAHGDRGAEGEGLSDRHRQGVRQPRQDQAARGQVVDRRRPAGAAAERQRGDDGDRLERPHLHHPAERRAGEADLAATSCCAPTCGRSRRGRRTRRTRRNSAPSSRRRCRRRGCRYIIPYGFVNNQSAALMPPDRLAQLPTAPDVKKDLLIYDTAWWADNRDAVLARWNKFLLG